MSDTVQSQQAAIFQMLQASGVPMTAENLNRASLFMARGDDNAASPVFETAMQRTMASPNRRQVRQEQQQQRQPAQAPVTYGQAFGGGQAAGTATTATGGESATTAGAAAPEVPPEVVAGATGPKDAAAKALAANGITDPAIVERALAGIPDSPPTADMPTPQSQVSPDTTSRWTEAARGAGMTAAALATALLTRKALKPGAAPAPQTAPFKMEPIPPQTPAPAAPVRAVEPRPEPVVAPPVRIDMPNSFPTAARGVVPIDPVPVSPVSPNAIPIPVTPLNTGASRMPAAQIRTPAAPSGPARPVNPAAPAAAPAPAIPPNAANNDLVQTLVGRFTKSSLPTGPRSVLNYKGGGRTTDEALDAARNAATAGGRRPHSPVPPGAAPEAPPNVPRAPLTHSRNKEALTPEMQLMLRELLNRGFHGTATP